MRVLHLLDTVGPGGAETVFIDVASRIVSRGLESIPVVAGEGWVARTLRTRGLEPLLIPSSGSFDLSYLRRLMQVIRTERVDVVHAHLLTSSVYGSIAARLSGVPSIATFHGLPDLGSPTRRLRLKFQLLNRVATRVVFVSDTLRVAFLARTSLRPRGSEVIHNGIDVHAMRVAPDSGTRAEFGVRPGELLVVSIGNIRPAKAYDVLLRSARKVVDAGVACRFLIVGHAKEPLNQQLLDLRDQLGLESHVTFIGFREDVARILAAANLFLLTSSTEGFSLATVQAMAAGVPVVATRSGGPEEIVADGVTGLLADVGDAEQIAAAVLRLHRDRSFATMISAAARQHVSENFTVDRMVDRYVRLYEDLAHPRPPLR